MNEATAQTFAERWADAWNRRSFEEVLAHFHDDVIFVSPTALAVTGSSTLRGKTAVRAYWTKAMSGISEIEFTLDHIFWASERRELAIIYVASINGKARRVSENLAFDAQDLVVAVEVFHGAPQD